MNRQLKEISRFLVVFWTCFALCTAQSTTAIRVYGQLGSFTTHRANKNGVSANSLYDPAGVFVDISGVYIVDHENNRVLFYPGDSTTPSRVYGQLGSFTTNQLNKNGLSANSLFLPSSVFVDSSGVYIADTNNQRVLFYPGESTTASRVYGQDGDFTSSQQNKNGVSANSLFFPSSVAVDSSGVYIVDLRNNRVLFYPGRSTTASRVYGQLGSFTTNRGNKNGVSASSLYDPQSVVVDSSGVYIVDYQNNRALFYPGRSTTASRVYGQDGNFTSDLLEKNGVSGKSLFYPNGLAADSSGVYISDSQNSRVLFYPGESTTATRVYGQHGNFTTRTDNYPAISASSLSIPQSVTATSSGVYIADGINRVLFYPKA